jgi:hypothetical protein
MIHHGSCAIAIAVPTALTDAANGSLIAIHSSADRQVCFMEADCSTLMATSK